MLVVDCVGKGGGLALLWKEEMGVEIQNYSCRHINVKICQNTDGEPLKFMGFYGHSDASKRKEGWGFLRHLAPLDPSPWVCMRTSMRSCINQRNVEEIGGIGDLWMIFMPL